MYRAFVLMLKRKDIYQLNKKYNCLNIWNALEGMQSCQCSSNIVTYIGRLSGLFIEIKSLSKIARTYR